MKRGDRNCIYDIRWYGIAIAVATRLIALLALRNEGFNDH
jgi:hypothetical protein